MRGVRRRCGSVVAALALAATMAAPVHAQADERSACIGLSCDWSNDASISSLYGPRSGSSLEVVGANAALGAVTAAVVAKLTGRPVVRALALGAVGGTVTYLGKEVAVRGFDGSGLLARQVGAVGASITRDAVEGAPAFRRVILPLGVARLHLDADARNPVRFRADLAAIVAMGIALQDGGRLDMPRSISSGTPIFEVRRDRPKWSGLQVAGVIWLREDLHSLERHSTIAHEMVHVLQHDAAFISWAEPLERAMLSKIPGVSRVHRWSDFGLQVGVRAIGNTIVKYESRPWEWEAGVMAGTRH